MIYVWKAIEGSYPMKKESDDLEVWGERYDQISKDCQIWRARMVRGRAAHARARMKEDGRRAGAQAARARKQRERALHAPARIACPLVHPATAHGARSRSKLFDIGAPERAYTRGRAKN